jgi:tRNA A-37 threonylcarbamoyl transferase component Bud32
MASLLKALWQVRRLGVSGLIWVIYAILIAPLLHRVLVPVFELQRQLVLPRRYGDVASRFEALRLRFERAPPQKTSRTRALRDVCPELERIVAKRRQPSQVLPLALIDWNGRGLPLLGVFWSNSVIPPIEFHPGDRHSLLFVDFDGDVGVLKSFRKRSAEFVNELETASALHAAGCGVPDILHVDFDRLEIVYSYIAGIPLRAALIGAGADFRGKHKNTLYGRLQSRLRRKRVTRAERGRPFVPAVMTRAEIARVGSELAAIHRAGFTLEDIKYGNIIIEDGTGAPIFIDFECAFSFKDLPRGLSTYIRDKDSAKLNAHIGSELPTAAGLRKLRKLPGGAIYAPVYVGQGIWWGAIWNPDVGVGRWRSIMRKELPIPKGGRILDLGANNGYNALQMLHAGAREVVAVEINSAAIEQGRFLRRVYEWRDNTEYKLTYVQGSHGNLPSLSLGRFDQVTAFCTLYYLSRAEMIATVRYVRSLTDVLVQQANTDRVIRRKDHDTFNKASLAFTTQLAILGGFDAVQVVSPRGYSRPLVIGRATSDIARQAGRGASREAVAADDLESPRARSSMR